MIEIEINNFNDIFNQFNSGELSDILDNYIKEKSKLIPLKNMLIINVKGKFNDKEKQIIIDTIHNHYLKINKYYQKIDKYDDIYRIVLMLLGTILIVISSYFKSFISEIFLIAGWVSIWESFYDLIFTRSKRKIKNKVYFKLSKCEITFKN